MQSKTTQTSATTTQPTNFTDSTSTTTSTVPATSSTATTSSTIPSGWMTETSTADQFRIAYPADWQFVGPNSQQKGYRLTNPALAKEIAEYTATRPGTGLSVGFSLLIEVSNLSRDLNANSLEDYLKQEAAKTTATTVAGSTSSPGVIVSYHAAHIGNTAGFIAKDFGGMSETFAYWTEDSGRVYRMIFYGSGDGITTVGDSTLDQIIGTFRALAS